MASWGNATGTPYPQDMDSSGQKLVVRNSGASAGADYQAEITDTSAAAQALRVNGKLEFKRSNRICGHIEPDVSDADPSYNLLTINTGENDPHVRIGHGTSMESTGNTVTVLGKHIWLGATADENIYRTALAGPVSVGTENPTQGALRVFGAIHVVNNLGHTDGKVNTNGVDALNLGDSLAVGGLNAGNVNLARTGVTTHVLGPLSVQNNTQLSGDLHVSGLLGTHGEGINTNGGYVAAGQVFADSVSGTVIASGGNLTCGGDLTCSGRISVSNEVRGGSLQTSGAIAGGSLTVNQNANFHAAVNLNGMTLRTGALWRRN